MKKTLNQLVALLIAVVMVCSISLSANAAGEVTYSADSDKFIFAPGSSHSPTDLFTEFKSVMPGDSIKQEITVKNDASEGVKVKLYVRSRGAQENSSDFLSKLHLTVAKSEQNKMAYMFDAAAHQTGGMTDWFYLGTLYSGGEVNLVLNLDIPIELGNEYQNAIGYIDWEFKAEELPAEPDDPVPPPMGDSGFLALYVALVCFSGIAMILLIAKRRKKQRE